MAVLLSPVGGVAAQFFTNAGVPLSGGKFYTYAAGTSTPQATYTTGAGNIQHSNPIVLDAAGRVPTGEIWLTDGLSYKFVLKDANDVLIATYDNIVGINSNFVNFVNQQEIQTATAGQTVFTLTTMEYQPGTGNLSVFVDGVNQYGPGAQYAYTETSSTVITFVSGLHVGASVKFTTTEIQNSGVADASQITYTYPDANAVQESVEERLAQRASVTDFGAVGDGVTDDTTAFANALAASKYIWIPEGTYLVDTISLLDVHGYNIEGASETSTILKGKSTSSVILNVAGSAPGGLNTYNVFKNFSVDLSAMNSVTPGAAIGIKLINTWGNSFYNILTIGGAAAQNPLSIGQHVYTTVFDNCDFYGTEQEGTINIDGTYTGLDYSTTTLTFIGCSFARCLMQHASSVTFIQPIIQGALNKFQMNYVSGITIIGGDIEGTQTYLAFGVNCSNVFSTNNALIGFSGTYTSGTLISGQLNDQINGPYQIINGGGTRNVVQTNGMIDEILPLATASRKYIKNTNATSQIADINFGNANGDVYVGMDAAGNAYIDNRGTKITYLSAVGTNIVKLDATGTFFFGPAVDTVPNLGGPSNRWATVYAVTGSINTSDANEKQDIVELSDAEKRVAQKLKASIKRFKFKDATLEKGDKARYHFGTIAQDVKSAFESEGLVAEEYGVFCSDILEDGGVRLGVRYDELFAFIIGSL